MRTITIVNQSTVVPDADFAAAVKAGQTQLDRDFSPAWGGLGAELRSVKAPPGASSAPIGETIYILDDSDQAGALGYHALTGDVPVGFVFVRTAADGVRWEVTLSHELMEQLVDPYCASCAVVPAFGLPAVAVEYEVADPVEGDAYLIGDVPVSNFVLPAWFQPAAGAVGPFDFMRRLPTSLAMSPGGYIGCSTDLASWQQVFASAAKRDRRANAPAKYHRAGKRSYSDRSGAQKASASAAVSPNHQQLTSLLGGILAVAKVALATRPGLLAVLIAAQSMLSVVLPTASPTAAGS